jgi:hypothetical protein
MIRADRSRTKRPGFAKPPQVFSPTAVTSIFLRTRPKDGPTISTLSFGSSKLGSMQPAHRYPYGFRVVPGLHLRRALLEKLGRVSLLEILEIRPSTHGHSTTR